MTYSILAQDPRTGDIGGAVQSHYFAVGRRCLTLRPGIGAVASQAQGSARIGPTLLGQLEQDDGPLDRLLVGLLSDDAAAAQRQVLVLDAQGRVAIESGSGCLPCVGHQVGDGVVAAGNTLAADGIPARMVAAFERATGPLPHRLLAALEAAEEAGGDLRGKMSAAVRVVGPERVEFDQDGTRVDIRVDHHHDPIAELRRLLTISDGHAVLVDRVLSAGRLVGTGRAPVEQLDPDLLDRDLEQAQHAVGAEDREPTFWRGVVALRLGRLDHARELLATAIAANPAFLDLLRGVDDVGRATLPAGFADEVLRAVARGRG